MAVPIANFTFQPTGLSIQFTDLSANIPGSWAWDFGDSNNSTTQNPINVYASAGQYVVRFTATNGDGNSQVIKTINVSVNPILPLSISEIINCRLPSAISLDELCKTNFIRKWQLYLQELVIPNISITNVFIESAWPPLVNMLIAELVSYELIQNTVRQAAIPSSSAKGPIKLLKTGPAEAQWYSNYEAGQNAFKAGGVFDTLRIAICTLAARLRISLPMCSPLPQKPFVFHKQGRTRTNRPVFPFTEIPKI